MDIELGDLKEKLIDHLDKTWATSTKRSAKETAEALLSWERAKEQFDDLVSTIGDLKNKKLLEVGSGYGLFLATCLENGIKAEGVEPASQDPYKLTLKISQEVLRRSGFNPNLISQAKGENLPYQTDLFDVVVSLFTLEHVRDVKKVLEESVRVLKGGGYLYSVVPNYGSFWETHYGIIWIPYIPKSLARIYVRIWGKNPKLLDEFQFVNQRSLEKILRNLPLTILSWGNELFKKRVFKLRITELSTAGSAKKILEILKALKLSRLVILVADLFKAQTPIVLIARKNKVGGD